MNVEVTQEFFSNVPAPVWAAIGALIAAVIAAGVTFFGFFLNNHFENKRKKLERQHKLTQTAYFGAVEYLSHMIRSISQIPQKTSSEVAELINSDVQKNFYTLFLVASPQVIKSFTKLSDVATAGIGNLARKKMLVDKLNGEVKSCDNFISFHQKHMSEIQTRIDYLREKQMLNDGLLNSLLDNHQSEYKNSSEQLRLKGEALEKASIAQLELINVSLSLLYELAPLLHESIFSMRTDLDTELTNYDKDIIRVILQKSVEETRTGMASLITDVEAMLKDVINDNKE